MSEAKGHIHSPISSREYCFIICLNHPFGSHAFWPSVREILIRSHSGPPADYKRLLRGHKPHQGSLKEGKVATTRQTILAVTSRIRLLVNGLDTQVGLEAGRAGLRLST